MSQKISVVIPYYNAHEFIGECLDSIVAQTRKPGEIIVVNDGSTQQSSDYLDKYQNIARIIHLRKNAGISNARNIGIENARGDWIAFQDADDIWEPAKLEKQLDALEKNSHWDGCYTGVTTFSDNEPIITTYCDKPNPITIKDLLIAGHVLPSSFMIKKAVLQKVSGFDPSFECCQDYDLIIRLVKAGDIIGFVPEPLIRFRRSHHGNISSSWDKTLKDHLMIVWWHRDLFLRYGRLNGTRKFIARSLRSSGGKCGGLVGKLLHRSGVILGF